LHGKKESWGRIPQSGRKKNIWAPGQKVVESLKLRLRGKKKKELLIEAERMPDLAGHKRDKNRTSGKTAIFIVAQDTMDREIDSGSQGFLSMRSKRASEIMRTKSTIRMVIEQKDEE
jgi:hypothetical protein